MDGRVVSPGTHRRDKLIQLIISELKQDITGDSVEKMAVNLAKIFICPAETGMLCPTRKLRIQRWFEDAALQAKLDEAKDEWERASMAV